MQGPRLLVREVRRRPMNQQWCRKYGAKKARNRTDYNSRMQKEWQTGSSGAAASGCLIRRWKAVVGWKRRNVEAAAGVKRVAQRVATQSKV